MLYELQQPSHFLLLNNSPLELFVIVEPKHRVGFGEFAVVDVSDENKGPVVDEDNDGNKDVPPEDVVAKEKGFVVVAPDPKSELLVVEPNRPVPVAGAAPAAGFSCFPNSAMAD